jgi:hypothetical protein
MHANFVFGRTIHKIKDSTWYACLRYGTQVTNIMTVLKSFHGKYSLVVNPKAVGIVPVCLSKLDNLHS